MKRSLIVFFLFLAAFFIFGETIKFSADSMTGTAGSKSDTTVLTGNAFVQTSTMEIRSDKIELSGKDYRYIIAEGTVSGKNTESQLDFKCGKMKYDRTTKIAILEDSVHLVDLINDVTADAQLIEYNQDSETAVMQINITLKQKNNTCTSAFAVYRKKAQVLEMSGNPKIVQGEDAFRAQEITLNLDTQEIILDGRVSGTVTDTKKKEENTPDKNEALPDSMAENPPFAGDEKENSPAEKEPSAEQNKNSGEMQ